MELVEKKSFSILNLDKEVEYITAMEKSGHKLVKVDGDGYHFYQSNEPRSPKVIVEFFEKGREVKPINFYTDQGLELISSYEGVKGTWNYFTGLSSTDSIEIREDDVEAAVKTVMRRLEIFWTMIAISIFFLSLYMFVQTKNPIFLIMIAASGALGVYIEKIRRSIKIRQNKMRGE